MRLALQIAAALEEALVAYQKAQEIDPLSPIVQADLGYIGISDRQLNHASCRKEDPFQRASLRPTTRTTNAFAEVEVSMHW